MNLDSLFGKTEQYRGSDGRMRTRRVTPEMEKRRTLESLPDYKKPFLRGSTFGVEDEKRFLASLGIQSGQPAAAAPAPAPATAPSQKTQSTYKAPEIDYSAQIKEMQGQFADTISDLQSGFQQQLGSLQQSMAAERKEAARRMEEMTIGFQNAIAQQRNKPQVEGIRFATSGTGGATQQQLAKRGVSGTFGRGGSRLLKISSLNV